MQNQIFQTINKIATTKSNPQNQKSNIDIHAIHSENLPLKQN